MASENSSQQPVVESAATTNPNQVLGSKDDPGKSIQKILGIVEKLIQMLPPPPGKGKGILTKSKTTNMAGAPSDPPATLDSVASGPATFGPTDSLKDKETENSIPKLQRNLRLLKEDVEKLNYLNQEVGEEVKKHIHPLDRLLQQVVDDASDKKLTKGNKKDLDDINKKIFNLMCQVPLLPNKRKYNKGSNDDDGDVINNGKGIVCLQGIHANDDLRELAVFRQVRDEFKSLSDDRKICLLSFAVFPENQEVNRTMLMYWWIGESILSVPGAECAVKEILNDFTKRKLIEPVENKRKVEPNSYKMTPFVHSSVVLISKEIGLFDMYHKGKKPTMKQSRLNKVCLVEDSSNQQEAKAKKMPAGEIETVFNVSERFPDFTFKWFSEDQPSGKKKINPISKPTYKNLKVFYLGRWERTAKRHIEVENPELMKYLRHMTKIRLLSFQGISRIERLDDAVCKLHELIILDLRACYNLEKLPDKIDSLKDLIYLDITDCYMIDRMPKRLSWLDNLEVLKGFVVSDADEETVCTLVELKHLKKLRKLSITINKDGFTVMDLFRAIEEFEKLEKFKVAWGGMNKEQKKDAPNAVQKFIERTMSQHLNRVQTSQARKDPKLPETLKKLDLQCFPDADLPTWLKPQNLGGVEKLYIKGGTKLTGFGELEPPEVPTKCKVKILRLKFLPRLKVEWRELRELYFPKLEFLEKYQCPQVSFCPCDGIGIWRST